MNTATSAETKPKYVLGIVRNPYPNVCLIEADEDGTPVTPKMRKYSGKFKDDGSPIYSGAWHPYKTLDTRIGGIYRTETVWFIDRTPRTYEEAMELATSVPRIVHQQDVDGRMNDDALNAGTFEGWRKLAGL